MPKIAYVYNLITYGISSNLYEINDIDYHVLDEIKTSIPDEKGFIDIEDLSIETRDYIKNCEKKKIKSMDLYSIGYYFDWFDNIPKNFDYTICEDRHFY